MHTVKGKKVTVIHLPRAQQSEGRPAFPLGATAHEKAGAEHSALGQLHPDLWHLGAPGHQPGPKWQGRGCLDPSHRYQSQQEKATGSVWQCKGGRGTPHPSVPRSRPGPPTGCMQGPVLPGSPASGACLPAAPQVPGPTGQGLATMESCAPALGSCPPPRGQGGTCTGPAQEEKVIHATFSNQHAGFWQAPAPTRLPKPPRAVFLWPAPNTLLGPPAVSVSAALGRHGDPLQGQVNNCCCFGTRRSQ